MFYLGRMEKDLSGQILLVGEGDFSFAVSLVSRIEEQDRTHTTNVTATSLETDTTITKHEQAAANMEWLQQHG